MSVKKIVLLGPESSGKTTLAAALATQYDTEWLPEQARLFLERAAGRYGYSDLYEIALLQQRSEAEIDKKKKREQAPFIFLDTNLLMIQVWSEIVFGRCDNRILTAISRLHYDHYLLCRPDIPWEPDPFREHPAEKDRERIFSHYLEMLNSQHISFTILEGPLEQRMNQAAQSLASIV
jgi:hypothetical protein